MGAWGIRKRNRKMMKINAGDCNDIARQREANKFRYSSQEYSDGWDHYCKHNTEAKK